MRLTKAKRLEYIKQIKLSRQGKQGGKGTSFHKDNGLAWLELTWDHFAKLHLDLRHLSDWRLRDMIIADAIDEEDFLLPEYLEHYNVDELQIITRQIEQAHDSLLWINKKVVEELNRKLKKEKGGRKCQE